MHALDLPEITSLIAQYLSRPDLVSCIRVQKSWYSALLPYVWNHITLSPISTHGQLALTRHAHLVQSLDFSGLVIQEYGTSIVFLDGGPLIVSPFPRLTRLHLYVDNVCLFPRELVSLLELYKDILAMSPLVKDIRMDSSMILQDTGPLLRAIQEHSMSLQCLRIAALEFTTETMEALRDICPRLISLELSACRLADVSWINAAKTTAAADTTICSTSNEKFLGLRHLGITYMDPPYHLIATFAALFRRIQSLDLELRMEDMITSEAIARFATCRTWPCLDSLAIHGQWFEYHMSDDELARIFSAMTACKGFRFEAGQLGFKSMEQLSRHFPTLERLFLSEVEVSEDREYEQDFFSTVLSSCPKLKEMQVWDFDLSEAVDSPDWVCLDLTHFHARLFERERRRQHQNMKAMFERLGRLKQIESIRFLAQNWYKADGSEPLMDLRLGQGVEMLSGLKRLKHLDLSGVAQNLAMEDLEWMVKHWPRLETVVGHLSYDQEVQQEMADYLERKGIQFRASS